MGNRWTFPYRNRIMAGMAKATLVIEATVKSGTLITSKYAGDFNRDVLALPGEIFNPVAAGPHMLIRGGATPITCTKDLREALGFKEENDDIYNVVDQAEKSILDISAPSKSQTFSSLPVRSVPAASRRQIVASARYCS